MNFDLQGTAKNTPKNATPMLHIINCDTDKFNGPPSSGLKSFSNAGITPTKPALRGMEPTATAMVCTKTRYRFQYNDPDGVEWALSPFSTGVNGKSRCFFNDLNIAKPMREDGIDIMLTYNPPEQLILALCLFPYIHFKHRSLTQPAIPLQPPRY